MSAYYPVYLDLKGKKCVVFGGGAVAEGKISKLRDSVARITVISPEVTPGIRAAAENGELAWQSREYQPGDLDQVFLAIAATPHREVNHEISREADRRSVLLNVVDDPSRCSFIAPSIVQRGEVTLAISTGGASPALARKLRESLSCDPVLEWADLAPVLAQVRSRVKRSGVKVDRQRWQCSLTPELLELAQSGREKQAGAKLLSALLEGGAPELCPQLDRCVPQGCSSKPDCRQS